MSDKRRRAREHKRRQQARRLAELNRTARTCQRRAGRSVCGGVLRHETDGHGAVVTTCPRCVRRERGICQECPRPVYGAVRKALRCAVHHRQHRTRICAAYHARHRAQHARVERDRVRRLSEEARRRRNELKKAWRLLRRDRARRQKWRANESPAARARRLAWHRQHRAAQAKGGGR